MSPEFKPDSLHEHTETEQGFRLFVVEKLAVLDTKVTSLVGNGQPGRIDGIETRIDALAKRVGRHDRYFFAAGAVGIVAAGVAKFWAALKGIGL